VLEYPKRGGQWYPDRPTVGQVAFGVVFFLGVTGLLLYWSAGESGMGNRILLWVMAGLSLLLGIWRIAIGVLLVREDRRHRRAIRGPRAASQD
jgi:apolipoprotein N-acyltransferase